MPDRTSEDMPERARKKCQRIMPDRMSEDMPDRMPERMSEDMPDRMPERMSELLNFFGCGSARARATLVFFSLAHGARARTQNRKKFRRYAR